MQHATVQLEQNKKVPSEKKFEELEVISIMCLKVIFDR